MVVNSGLRIIEIPLPCRFCGYDDFIGVSGWFIGIKHIVYFFTHYMSHSLFYRKPNTLHIKFDIVNV